MGSELFLQARDVKYEEYFRSLMQIQVVGHLSNLLHHLKWLEAPRRKLKVALNNHRFLTVRLEVEVNLIPTFKFHLCYFFNLHAFSFNFGLL